MYDITLVFRVKFHVSFVSVAPTNLNSSDNSLDGASPVVTGLAHRVVRQLVQE